MRAPAFLLAGLLATSLASTARADVSAILGVDATTSVRTTLLSMGEDTQPATPVGSVVLHLGLTQDPVYGLVAQSVEILPASLAIGDLGWGVSGSFEDLEVTLTDGAVDLASSRLAAVPVGDHTAELAASDFTVGLQAGLLTATGTVLDQPIAVLRELATETWPIDLSQPATIVTTPLPGGAVAVELRIPVQEGVPLAPPFLVSWLTVDGTLVLSGTTTVPVPASPHPLWIGVALVLATLAADRAMRRGGGREHA